MLFDIDKKDSSSTAVIDDRDNSLTYGELADYCRSIGGVLDARELVFCLCENTVDSLAGFISLYNNNDVALLLNASTDKKLIDDLIELYRPAYLWLPYRLTKDYNGSLTCERGTYCLLKTGYRSPSLNDKLSLLLTTSGTTGSPKLVRHKYGNIETNAKNVAAVFGWSSEERAICDLPMQYTMGLNVINSHLYAGATVLLMSNNLLNPKFWSFIKEHQATNFTGVPYSYEILNKIKFSKMDLPFLRTLAQGGGRLPDSLFRLFADYAGNTGKRFIATFGTTETSARLAYLPCSMSLTKVGSIGKSLPEGNMYLTDDLGKVINENCIQGELCYDGPNVTMGYAVCQTDFSKGDEFNGTYKTGDIAFRDEDGFYYIVGRKKRFLKLFGLRVGLDQCEKLISEQFNLECACTGTDKQMVIYINEESQMDNVRHYIAAKTGIISSAFAVRFIDAIPRNDSGKIDYKTLC